MGGEPMKDIFYENSKPNMTIKIETTKQIYPRKKKKHHANMENETVLEDRP